MYLITLPILARVLAIKISTLIERLVVHPHAVKGLLAVRLAQPGSWVHALALDELDFGVYFEDLLLCHYFSFLLDYGGRKRFQRFSGGLALPGFDWADPDLFGL